MTPRATAARSPWYATPVVAIGILLGLNGFSTMVTWGSWFPTVVGLVSIVAVLIVVTRLISRSRFLPTLVGATVALLVSMPTFARDDVGNPRLLPTPSALRNLATTVGDGVHEAATTVAPAEMTRPLVALFMVGIFAAFLLAEHLAVSWRSAALAGLVLLAPWMPAVVLQHRVSTSALLGAIAAWVLLLALTTRHTGSFTSFSPWAAGSATIATVALVAVVAPTALGANGWGSIPRFATPEQFDTTSRLNLALDLRNSLTANSSSPKIVYFTEGRRPDAFRLYSLIDFDGTAWSRPDADTLQRVPLDEGVQWPTPVDNWGTTELDRVSVQVLSQAESSLPLPTAPRSVIVNDDWQYVPALDEVRSDNATTRDLGYEFVADLDYFTIDGLKGLGDASSQDSELDPGHLALADSIDVEGVREAALEVVGGASTRYDKALALQEFFRNTQDFTYDTSVLPSGDDSISRFLEDRSGYCVQFASAMVIMARTLDIPARLAIGFLPGERGADGESIITGANAHAWPELYFAGAGWVRFEPTPAVQTGARPAYADPAGANPLNTIDEFPIPGGLPTTAPSSAPEPVDTPGAGAEPDESSAPAWWLWLAVAAVILSAVVAWQLLRSRRVSAERVDDPERVWAWLLARLPQGLAWPNTMTPHESEAHLRANLLKEEVFLSSNADHAFSRLVVAVSDHRYAPHGATASIESLSEDARIVADEVAASKDGNATGRRSRVGAPGAPRLDA
ncbi:DUF3488 and transglutaminase-like domain-containing protein [Demequina sp. TTPB684]|uniref:transglutaminase family protein n=1 Tax=unclassified Demequina TaxID=2620311 RepID=UPI001CF4A2EA|nr:MULTISPECIES: transglutaminase domain-containing protein [unclassified Demequina]MCB2413753.1 DUF3488 and transglutaminase-like domain-containing protein [Demequina sp. TTPB684]UPU89576.1 DUF3488 and transglutaminase-like domain-containing protein [Demequina sp. TMPB413]